MGRFSAYVSVGLQAEPEFLLKSGPDRMQAHPTQTNVTIWQDDVRARVLCRVRDAMAFIRSIRESAAGTAAGGAADAGGGAGNANVARGEGALPSGTSPSMDL